MNRNQSKIESEDQILNAARTVYQIVKLLKLTREDYLDMMQIDVLSKIGHGETLLNAFAYGVQQVYLTILLTEHCEFVYRSDDGMIWSVKEVLQRGPAVRSACVCGHRWLGSDFFFTEPAKEVDPWL